MSTPTPKRAQPVPDPPEVVDPRWLLKALALTILAAVLCSYLAVCLLVWQGSWQLLLHPSARVDRTPAIPFQPVRFDAGATGTPRLTAWWIPADSLPSAPTILFLHDGTGSLADSVSKLTLLHQAPVNIFAIDYRGFGQSLPTHPSEARMAEDTLAAFDYLVNTRHLAPSSIIPYGQGIAASLAANLAAAHPELPALILDNPDLTTVQQQLGSGRLLPMHLLIRDRFDLARSVAQLKVPKLLIAGGPGATLSPAASESFFRSVDDPRRSAFLPTAKAEPDFIEAIKRFLQEYVSASAPALTSPR